MSIEISPQGYNRLPEASYRDPRYIDISYWAEGERTWGLAERDLGRRTSRTSFSSLPGEFGDGSPTILLPGTFVSASHTFQEQIPVIERLGDRPVLADYSNSRFSEAMLKAQLLDFMDSALVGGKKVNLMGVSLGSTSILDLLLEEPEARERVNKVVLMGALYSSHDFKPSRLNNALRRAKRLGLVREPIVKAVMPLARSRIKVEHDPELVPYEEAIQESRRLVSNRALSERLYSIFRRESIGGWEQIPDIPVLFIFWEKDESVEPRQVQMMSSFANSERHTVSGNHGWTLRSASEINPRLEVFFRAENEELLAA